MNIIWHYLDKRGAAINALKDYGSMQYIIDHTDEEIDTVHDRMSSVGSPVLSDMPKGPHNPQANENRIIAAIDEIDVLKERYRQAVEYMDWFKPAWMALSEDERYVLQTFYWNEDERQADAVYDICDHFNIERSSAYNKRTVRFSIALACCCPASRASRSKVFIRPQRHWVWMASVRTATG